MNASIRAYTPVSWFHPIGVHRAVARIKERLPDVGGKLFLTFTVDPSRYENAEVAYEHSRDKLRRIFHKLRKGVNHEGKNYRITEPYCVKTEFHENGFAHFHVVFLTRRFLPAELLNHIWGLGRTNVARIRKEDFHYLLKYVSKSGELPAWVGQRLRIRIFQASRGFYTEPLPRKERSASAGKLRKSYTISERLMRWKHTAVIRSEREEKPCVRQVLLTAPYKEIFDHLVYSVALDGRYLGNGNIKITNQIHIIQWLQNQPSTQQLAESS